MTDIISLMEFCQKMLEIVAEPLVFSALNGFNGILMCYGQTGTGLLLNN